MKTLTVFGASGRTGSEILVRALNEGYKVNAFCRDKKKVTITNDNLKIIEGNILNTDDVFSAVNGSTYVISAIGTLPPHEDIFCYDAMKNIIYAMYEYKVKRLVCITGAMIGDFVPNQSWFMKFMTRMYNKKKPLAALDRLKQELAVKASKLNWTLVKPPRLNMGELTDYTSGENISITGFSRISRKTLASVVVNFLDDRSTFEKSLYVKKK